MPSKEQLENVLGPRPEGGTVLDWEKYLRARDPGIVWALIIKDEMRAVRPIPGDEQSGPWKVYSKYHPRYAELKEA